MWQNEKVKMDTAILAGEAAKCPFIGFLV